jgi:hypothetical protein
MSTLRLKSILAVLVVTAIAGMVPLAHATTPAFPVVIAGSSAMFNTMALGAYNGGHGPVGAVGQTFHWTSGSNALSLSDTRPQAVGATSPNEDAASVWVVWDSSTAVGGPNVWVYAKVDSVVGDRCFFAQPHCVLHDLASGNADWIAAGGNKIADPCSSTPGNLWGDNTCDTSLPGPVLAIVENAALDIVNVAATDIRAEDAAWAIARVNSSAGASLAGGVNSDGTDGLGYNAANPSGQVATGGVCPLHVSLAQLQGTAIYSGYGHTGTSTDAANVLAFNITGKDPATCTAIPTYTVANVGASPIVFVNSRSNTLATLVNASERQLSTVFSGTNTDASALGLTAGNINAFVREPLSGTYNTTEATVMRYPTLYSAATPAPVEGLSQELNTVCTGVLQNPLAGQACTVAAGLGKRWRGVGTSEVVGGVQHSNDGTKVSNITDGIAYTFFSYGNVAALADSASFGYIQLNGVDPIFQTYNTNYDPGQPTVAKGRIPGTTETTFPACENAIWANGYSFPNVRNGTYRAWSLLHLIYNSTQSTPVKNLITAGNLYAVTTVPDYVPAAKVTTAVGACGGTTAFVDLGLLLVRSHYAQFDGNSPSVLLGTAPNFPGLSTSNTTLGGGDMGGMIIPTALGASTAYKTYMTQSGDANGGLGPALRH